MATSSMTSVPKPLKLLREHFSRLEDVYKALSPSPSQLVLADILSVQGMAMDDKERKILQYRLLGSQEKISSFGHPYVRSVCVCRLLIEYTCARGIQTFVYHNYTICGHVGKHLAN